MRQRAFRSILLTAVLVAGVLVMASLPAAAAPDVGAGVVGQVVSAKAYLDGVEVPSGTTLLSPAVVRTGTAPAILHLADGSVVALLAGSTARFELTPAGRLELVVEAGRVAYADERGEVVELAEPARAVWAFAGAALLGPEGQIGEGAATSEDEERLCDLIDWTAAKYQLCTVTDPDDSSCAWELLVVPASEAPELVGVSAVYAGTDRNDLGLDEDCKERVGAWLPLAAKVGIGIGAAALGACIAAEIDEEEKPASPKRRGRGRRGCR